MKVKIGMTVDGEVGRGPVVAMTEEWCIYLGDPNGKPGQREYAEPWSSIVLAHDGPDEVRGSILEKEI